MPVFEREQAFLHHLLTLMNTLLCKQVDVVAEIRAGASSERAPGTNDLVVMYLLPEFLSKLVRRVEDWLRQAGPTLKVITVRSLCLALASNLAL